MRKRMLLPSGYSESQVSKRREIIAEKTGALVGINETNSAEEMQGIIENHIGFLSIPIGIASPLSINGSYAQGHFYVPLCTVEGTLVASMTRGMLATSRSGGVQTSYIRQEVSRAPVFLLHSIKNINKFTQWVDKHFEAIRQVAEETTHFGKLIRIDKYILQTSVILDFVYSTGNAAGQNMVSLATLKAAEYIKKQYGAPYVLDSNFTSDKKASSINETRGRGHYVISETTISHASLKHILGVKVDQMKFQQEFMPYASSLAGMKGIQLHLANALAAIYIATGQDVACVAENALGYTQMLTLDEGVKFVLTMPSLTIGTVGGGTRLKSQRTNLQLLGCHEGEHASKKLAEIICASSLCLEISLWCAIASETWVQSHMKYGRTKK